MGLYLEEQLQAYWEGVHNIGSWTISRKKKQNKTQFDSAKEGKEIKDLFFFSFLIMVCK